LIYKNRLSDNLWMRKTIKKEEEEGYDNPFLFKK